MKILLVHGLTNASRQTNIDFALAGARYPHGSSVSILNIFGPIPPHTYSTKYDLLIITYEVVAHRTSPVWFIIKKRLSKLRIICREAVCFVQDDYTLPGITDEFLIDLKFTYCYSPLSEHAPQFYPKSLNLGVKFRKCLTGYIEPANYYKLAPELKPIKNRDLDLFNKIRNLSNKFGEEAGEKFKISQEFTSRLSQHGFKTNFSSGDDGEALLGNSWFKFLANSKFTITSLGGATVADPFGNIQYKINLKKFTRYFYSKKDTFHVNALGVKGDFRAISPRIFDAALTKTCQILVQGDYLPELRPGVHYIEAEKNLSNFSNILDKMRDLDYCQEIVENAWNVLFLKTDKYKYQELMRDVLSNFTSKLNSNPKYGKVHDLHIDLRSYLCLEKDEQFIVRDALIKSRNSSLFKKYIEFNSQKIINLLKSNNIFDEKINLAVDSWYQLSKKGMIYPESLIFSWIAPIP